MEPLDQTKVLLRTPRLMFFSVLAHIGELSIRLATQSHLLVPDVGARSRICKQRHGCAVVVESLEPAAALMVAAQDIMMVALVGVSALMRHWVAVYVGPWQGGRPGMR